MSRVSRQHRRTDFRPDRGRLFLIATMVSLVAACSAAAETTTTTATTSPTTTVPTTTTTLPDCGGDHVLPAEGDVVGDDASTVALALSALAYDCAHEAIVTADTGAAIAAGVALGVAADVPVLVDGPAVPGELERLGAQSVRWVGLAPAPQFGVDTTVVDPSEVSESPTTDEVPAADTVWVFASDPAARPLVEAAAAVRGHGFVDLTGVADVRVSPSEVHAQLAGREVVTVGVAPEDRWKLDTVLAGGELPGGGYTFDGTRLVAFYGNPTTSALGVLGEQDPAGTLERLAPLVEEYSADGLRGIPTFEIIATVASASAGPDNDYSDEAGIETLRPWIDFAGENGVYVVLDLQPGRTDFLTQASRYEEFLRLPHVGLALDPEWRLGPDQVHLRQIGTVDTAEINQVSKWLAGIVREEQLPQKYFLVHQFRFSMITNRELLATPPELYTVIQMDGQGPLPSKYETYRAITAGQDDVGWAWGWKNFYDEDSPTATPAEVLAVEPTVVFVSFQ